MKKYIVVVVALLYSFIGVNMVFADGDRWTHFNDKGITKPKISEYISPLLKKSKFAEVFLQSSMSRGYVWSYNLRKEGIVQEVSHKNIGGDSCRDDGNGLTMCTTSVSGKEIWTFKGLHEGETIAEFTLSHIHDSSLIEETIKILFTVNRRLEVKATYVTEVVLENNPSTGYSWDYTLREKSIVQEVSHKNIDGDNCVKFGIFEQCNVGVPGKEIWTFKGLREGETIAEFTYAQHWDGGLAGKTIKVLFTVNSRLEVKATYLTEVVLETNASTGNSLSYPLWSYTLSKQGIVQEISRSACSPFVSCMCIEGSACTCPNNCAEGQEIWTFKGLCEGETIAEFTHDTIGEKRWILFKVNSNLEIAAIYLETQ